jgi:hypothetical protein
MDSGTVGMYLQAAKAGMDASMAYFKARIQKINMLAQAGQLESQQRMMHLNQRMVGRQASEVLVAAHKAIGQRTMAAGQMRASTAAAMAARGLQAGVGSAAEILASQDYVKEVDAAQLNANAVRQAGQLRMQRASIISQGEMFGAQAQGLRLQQSAIKPWMAVVGSLLSSGGQMANSYAGMQMRSQ